MALFILLLVFHGVQWSELPGAKVFRISYESGRPMTLAKVIIIDRKAETLAISKTDSEGLFYFLPKGEGPWKIKVMDNYGHGTVIRLKGETMSPLKHPVERSSLIEKVLIGILLIWGVTGTVFYIVAKKKYAHP